MDTEEHHTEVPRIKCRIPANVRTAASLYGFAAFCAAAMCIMSAPSALFVPLGAYTFIVCLITAIACVLIRAGMLRAMRVSFWAAVILCVASVLLFFYTAGSELLTTRSLSIDVLILPLPIALLAVLCLFNLKSQETRIWFFDPLRQRPTSK
jgi:hypothetical protein